MTRMIQTLGMGDPAPVPEAAGELVRFEAREDGSIIRHVQREHHLTCRHEVMVAIDCSASMATYLKVAADGAMDFCNTAIRRQYHVGLIDFARESFILLRPTRDKALIRKWLSDLIPGGKTNMAAAIANARRVLVGHHARALLILSDGRPDDPDKAIHEASRARADGIEILTIGVGDARRDFLEEISTARELVVMENYRRLPQGFATASALLPVHANVGLLPGGST